MTTSNPSGRARVVLSGIGSRGDLLPLLAIAEQLHRRGHRCDVLSNQGFEDTVRGRGLGFRPITAPQVNNLVSGRDNLEQHVFPSYPPTYEYFRELKRHGERAVVVNLDEFSATNPMAELHGLAVCRLYLAPFKIDSAVRPNWPHVEKLAGPFAHTYSKYRLPQIYRRRRTYPYLVHRFNDQRRMAGLSRIDSVDQVDAPVRRRVALFPEWFAPRASDWPDGLQAIGFPLPKSASVLSIALRDFLSREGPPIVFTPGTAVPNAKRFFDEAARCCRALDRPGVFLSRHHSETERISGRIFHAPFVDLEPLLAQSSLLVHHGGIGTTARAIQAGIPQIVRSKAYDQPDNGYRVQNLNVGAFFPPGEGILEDLVVVARRLTSCPNVAAAVSKYESLAKRDDAVRIAADVVEKLIAQSHAERRAPRARGPK